MGRPGTFLRHLIQHERIARAMNTDLKCLDARDRLIKYRGGTRAAICYVVSRPIQSKLASYLRTSMKTSTGKSTSPLSFPTPRPFGKSPLVSFGSLCLDVWAVWGFPKSDHRPRGERELELIVKSN